MDGMYKVKIGEHVYTIQPFNPIEGLEFGTKLVGVLSPALGGAFELAKESGDMSRIGIELGNAFKDPLLMPMLRQAYNQCFTPDNQSLADEVAFNQWFLKYPQDMFELGVRAAYALVKSFSESARFNRERIGKQVDVPASENIVHIPIPEGWEVRAVVNRLVKEQYCTYAELKQMSMKDMFDMMLLLDWQDYVTAYGETLRKVNTGR